MSSLPVISVKIGPEGFSYGYSRNDGTRTRAKAAENPEGFIAADSYSFFFGKRNDRSKHNLSIFLIRDEKHNYLNRR